MTNANALLATLAALTIGGCTVGASLPFGRTAGYSSGGYSSGGSSGYASGGDSGDEAAAPTESGPDGERVSGSPRCLHDRAGAEFATAVPLGAGQNGGCVEGQKTDVYAITAPENPGGTVYGIHMVADQQICATIYNQDRQQLGGGECVSDNDSSFFWAAVAPGTTVYLKLERTFGKPSPYVLDVKEKQVEDSEEPNGTWKNAVALSFGKPHEAMLQLAINDRRLGADFYKVDVDDSGMLDVVIDPQSDDVQPELLLFDADRKQIVRENAENPGAILRMHQRVPAGRYYLVVNEDSSIIYAYGISGNGNKKPTSHFSTPYKMTVDIDSERPAKRAKSSRVSRR